ncbi:hypothetical protein [Pseudonocardia broussonetiae]|uniref:Phage-related protein n=1 Tax=Pseudonocardia broussonetiae TaxID=2736640 RepID=A0A6M6JJX6_9PSEU|nr:hypothetical protein [Pseudonocardia broussonetiae]QJY46651.1 hypothetical protein HOP40_13180 [Pseudonocardia broussonetiae]
MSRSMNFDVTANDNASREFLAMAAAAEKLEDRLKKLDRLTVEPTAQLNITPATRSAQQLQTRLDALKNVRATVETPGAAEARRDVTALVVEMRKLRNVRVRLDVDGTAKADVAALATALRTMSRDVKVKVELDDGTFLRDVTRLNEQVAALTGSTVRIDFDIQPPDIEARLASIAASLRTLRGTTTHKVQVDTGDAEGSVAEMTASLAGLARALAVPIAVPALISAAAGLGALGASAQDLVGAIGLIPGAGAAAGAALATLGLGMAHVADALGPTGTAAQVKKVNEALAALSPSAREVVGTLRGLGPAFSEMRLSVQEELFRDLTDVIEPLAKSYLPSLEFGLSGIAKEMNNSAASFAKWAMSEPVIADVNTILANTRTTMRELAPAGVNVAAALTDIATVGSEFLPELAAGATTATAKFREFVAEARKSGELERWISGGITSLQQLGNIAGNVGSVLGSFFAASIDSGFDLLGSVERLTGELSTLMSSVEGRTALVDTFRESGEAVRALLPGIRELSGAALSTIGSFAQTDGLERFTTLVSNLAIAVSPLVAQLGELAGGTLGALAGGAQIAVGALTPVIALVSGLVDGLGPVGPAVLAAVLAFKGLGLVAGPVAALGASMQVAAVSAAAFAGRMTGSAAIAAAAGTSTLALGSAVGALGRALPIVGVAAVGLGLALSSMSVSADDAVTALRSGGVAADNMRTALLEQQGVSQAGRSGFDDWANSVNTWVNSNVFGIASIESTNEAIGQQRTEMSSLQIAQEAATVAQNEYQEAVNETGSGSQRSRDAAYELATATDRVEAAQRAAEDATQSYSDRLRDQVSAVQSALGANVQLEDAIARVAEAEKAANDAAAEYGAGSNQAAEATREYVLAADQAAKAAQQVAEEFGGADAGSAAYGATLLNLAANAQGPARDALLSQLSMLSQTRLDYLSAGAAALGFATQVIELPDGKTVTIAIDPETGEIVDTQTLIDSMRDGEVEINLETQEALTDLESLVGVINGSGGSIRIDGNPQAAGVALQSVLTAISEGRETVEINGESMPAQQALDLVMAQIRASNAEVTIGGQNYPAARVLDDTLAAIRSGRDDVTIGGQSLPARSVLGVLLGDVGRASSTMTILARDGGVGAMKAALSRPSSSTHTITVVTRGGDYRTIGVGTQTRNHDGNVIPASSTWYAGGGTFPGRPFRAGTAQRFPPRHLRYTGDRTDKDEFYLPDNGVPRTMALGTEWARRRGMDLVPRNTMSTAGAGAPRGGVAALARVLDTRTGTGGGPVTVNQQEVVAAVRQLSAMMRAGYSPPDAVAGPIVAGLVRIERALGAGPSGAARAQASRSSAELLPGWS